MRKVILDASPLIFLAKAGLIKELQKLSKEFFITEYVKKEIDWPKEHGIKAQEIENIYNLKNLRVVKLTAKEMQKVNKLREKYKGLGIGELQSAVLWQRGDFDMVIVADVRAEKKLKEMGIKTIDIVDVGFILARKGLNPLKFARDLWEKAHYKTERIKEILHRYR